MWPAAAICHFNQQKRLSVPSKTEKLLPQSIVHRFVLDATNDFCLSVTVCELKCDYFSVIRNGTACSHCTVTKIHFSISAILYSTYHYKFVNFQLLCYVSEVLFIHSIWQLSFQSVSGNDFAVLPAVKHVSSFNQSSVAGLWDWVCDLFIWGSSWAQQGEKKEVAGEWQRDIE